MRKVFFLVWIIRLLAIQEVFAITPRQDERPRNIILIGWDGAQRNHVKECLERGELPNLKKLASEGIIVAIDNLRITDTKAGWAQILTGYYPEVTGVFSNTRYQPIPKGYTVFERLEEFFGSDNFVTLALSTKTKNIKIGPPSLEPFYASQACEELEEGEVVIKDGKKFVDIPGGPFLYTKYGLDMFINGLGDDKILGTKALELLREYKDKPFLLFIHFSLIDYAGHVHGENSKESNAGYIESDIWLGKIVQKLKELNIYDNTIIYVTSDHGFNEGKKGHSDAPYVFLATNDPQVMREGETVDITPTILERFGLDLDKIEPPLDGHPLTKTYKKPIW